MNMGTNFTFHKVMTIISWLDKISWPDMSCWRVEVIKVSCNVIRYIFVIILMHLVLKFWLWGRFVAEKQSYLLNLMAGHLLNMTYDENSK